MSAVVELDLDRRRYLLRRVMRKVEGWQSIWITSEYDNPCVAKGRYLAAKEFYDWLADGGEIAQAQEWLVARGKHYRAERDATERLIFAGELSAARAEGQTEETLKGWTHALVPGFEMSPTERETLRGLSVQHQASETELWHLERLLKDPFVKGEVNAPLPPPPPPVVDDDEDENDEPD